MISLRQAAAWTVPWRMPASSLPDGLLGWPASPESRMLDQGRASTGSPLRHLAANGVHGLDCLGHHLVIVIVDVGAALLYAADGVTIGT